VYKEDAQRRVNHRPREKEVEPAAAIVMVMLKLVGKTDGSSS